jgi:hypothetical protein
MLPRCWSKGKRHFIKWPGLDRGPEDGEAHVKTAATEEPAAGHQNYNQAPAYIREPGPLD